MVNAKSLVTASLALLMSSQVSTAGVIFSDNFDDNDTVGWSFVGSYSADWSAASGSLVSDSASGYVGNTNPGFALIDGIVTPTRFTLEADVTIISDVAVGRNPLDFGHIGFGWAVDPANPDQFFNTLYLRTHSDHVTHFSRGGSPTVERIMPIPGGATNDATYRLSVSVDSVARSMTTTLGSVSQTFSGADFDLINQNSGGRVGLITWGDKLSYDNVRLSVPDPIPVPATLALFGLGLLFLPRRGRH